MSDNIHYNTIVDLAKGAGFLAALVAVIVLVAMLALAIVSTNSAHVAEKPAPPAAGEYLVGKDDAPLLPSTHFPGEEPRITKRPLRVVGEPKPLPEYLRNPSLRLQRDAPPAPSPRRSSEYVFDPNQPLLPRPRPRRPMDELGPPEPLPEYMRNPPPPGPLEPNLRRYWTDWAKVLGAGFAGQAAATIRTVATAAQIQRGNRKSPRAEAFEDALGRAASWLDSTAQSIRKSLSAGGQETLQRRFTKGEGPHNVFASGEPIKTMLFKAFDTNHN